MRALRPFQDARAEPHRRLRGIFQLRWFALEICRLSRLLCGKVLIEAVRYKNLAIMSAAIQAFFVLHDSEADVYVLVM